DDHADPGGLRMADGLDRLRHHAVVGGYDQNDDVGDVGAPGTEGGERLVTGGVDERDLASVHLDLIGTDVLGDAAFLTGGHVGLANPVEERCLAVVDVTHDGDDRRPRLQVLLGVLEGGTLGDSRGPSLLFGSGGRLADVDYDAEALGHFLHQVIGHH